MKHPIPSLPPPAPSIALLTHNHLFLLVVHVIHMQIYLHLRFDMSVDSIVHSLRFSHCLRRPPPSLSSPLRSPQLLTYLMDCPSIKASQREPDGLNSVHSRILSLKTAAFLLSLPSQLRSFSSSPYPYFTLTHALPQRISCLSIETKRHAVEIVSQFHVLCPVRPLTQ